MVRESDISLESPETYQGKIVLATELGLISSVPINNRVQYQGVLAWIHGELPQYDIPGRSSKFIFIGAYPEVKDMIFMSVASQDLFELRAAIASNATLTINDSHFNYWSDNFEFALYFNYFFIVVQLLLVVICIAKIIAECYESGFGFNLTYIVFPLLAINLLIRSFSKIYFPYWIYSMGLPQRVRVACSQFTTISSFIPTVLLCVYWASTVELINKNKEVMDKKARSIFMIVVSIATVIGIIISILSITVVEFEFFNIASTVLLVSFAIAMIVVNTYGMINSFIVLNKLTTHSVASRSKRGTIVRTTKTFIVFCIFKNIDMIVFFIANFLFLNAPETYYMAKSVTYCTGLLSDIALILTFRPFEAIFGLMSTVSRSSKGGSKGTTRAGATRSVTK